MSVEEAHPPCCTPNIAKDQRTEEFESTSTHTWSEQIMATESSLSLYLPGLGFKILLRPYHGTVVACTISFSPANVPVNGDINAQIH